MNYRLFQPLNKELSQLCMGTMNLGSGADEALSFALLDAYVAMGGNFLDTARVYGAFETGNMGVAEQVIGHWLRARGNRNALTLATKGGYHDMITKAPRLDKASLSADLEASLSALGTSMVDIYWLHRDDPDRPVRDILETLHQFVLQGKVGCIGVSNWSISRIREAQDIALSEGLTPIACNQPMWSLAKAQDLADTTLEQMDAKLLAFHVKMNMPCIPYSAQAKGFFLKMLADGEQALKPDVRARYLSAENMRTFAEIREVCAESGMRVNAVTLAALMGQPFPVFPIVGASGMEQMRVLEGVSNARLQPELIARLMRISGLEKTVQGV